MPIEFVVSLKNNKYPDTLVLPEVFFKDFFNGNNHLYLTGLRRHRMKVRIVKSTEGPVEIRGKRWAKFVLENMDMEEKVLHFVQEGDDSFYVTGYDQGGNETGGYDGVMRVMRSYSRFQTHVTPYPYVPQKIVADFLVGLGNKATMRISCEGNTFNVCVNHVHQGSDGMHVEYLLNHDQWHVVVAGNKLQYGDLVVFTKVRNKRFNLMAFNSGGSQKTGVQFLGATQLNLNQPVLLHEEKADDRMYHLCMWYGHRDHFRESIDVFYKRFSEILAFSSLAIPADFLECNPMHIYRKALMKHEDVEHYFTVKMHYHKENPGTTNHVTAYGEWSNFGQESLFEYGKMLRFRFMYIVTDLGGHQARKYPVFHVC